MVKVIIEREKPEAWLLQHKDVERLLKYLAGIGAYASLKWFN